MGRTTLRTKWPCRVSILSSSFSGSAQREVSSVAESVEFSSSVAFMVSFSSVDSTSPLVLTSSLVSSASKVSSIFSSEHVSSACDSSALSEPARSERGVSLSGSVFAFSGESYSFSVASCVEVKLGDSCSTSSETSDCTSLSKALFLFLVRIVNNGFVIVVAHLFFFVLIISH